MRAALFAVAVAIAGGTGLLACNGVFGIDKAELEDGGASSGSSSGSAEAGAPDAGGFVAVDDCTDYCNDIAAACSAPENQEYLSTDVCKKLCMIHTNHYDEQGLNQPVDVGPTTALATGDSLYCRVWHSHAATVESPIEHCPHAGPLGASVCGTNPCDDFCVYATQVCTGANAAYASMQDCLQACTPNPDAGYAGFPYLMGTDGGDLQAGGNTLNCRMYHLENFLFTNDAVHCTHVTVDGGGVCVDVPSP
jgi:hypothetical protein